MKSDEFQYTISCPHFGEKDDPKMATLYPSYRCCCYRLKKSRIPLKIYQEEFCLSENHTQCAVFNDETLLEKDPDLAKAIFVEERAKGGLSELFRQLLSKKKDSG